MCMTHTTITVETSHSPMGVVYLSNVSSLLPNGQTMKQGQICDCSAFIGSRESQSSCMPICSKSSESYPMLSTL